MVSEERVAPTSIPAELLIQSDHTRDQDFAAYFAKPVVLRQGVFQSTDNSGTFTRNALFRDILTTGALLFEPKFRGVLGFRADVELNMVINGTRFQQGRYLLCFVPTSGTGSVGGASRINTVLNQHLFNLTTRTQVPHVEIDVNCDTECKLTIPFVHHLGFYPLGARSASDLDIGFYQILPYVPVNTGTVTFTLYARFINVQVFGTAVPQSRRLGSTVQEKERKDADIGPISSMLTKVSTASTILGSIPLLSTFTEPVALISSVLANAAAVFGWSKPNVLSAPCIMVQDKERYLTNFDAPSIAQPLSMSSSNELQKGAFARTDMDEMSFDYIKSIPAFLDSFVFTTSQAAQASIYNRVMDPFSMFTTDIIGLTSVITFLPFNFPSTMFNKYRGSVVLTLKCVKTEFHSGRVMVVFSPFPSLNVTPGALTFDNSQYVLRDILDIRMCNEWSFTIPYQSGVQWRSNGDTNQGYGRLQMFVVDPLVAPATVSSTITFLAEFSAAPDFEWAEPVGSNFSPVATITTQAGDMSGCVSKVGTLGNSLPCLPSVAADAYCIGEKFTSFRQILKRTGLTPQLLKQAPNPYLVVLPFSAPLVFINVAGTVTYPSHGADIYTHLCSMYSIVRGSVRIGFSNQNAIVRSNRSATLYLQPLVFGDSGLVNLATSDINDNYGNTAGSRFTTNLLAYSQTTPNALSALVQIPSYAPGPVIATGDLLTSPGPGAAFTTYPYVNSSAPRMCLIYSQFDSGTGTTNSIPQIHRSGADDMEFQYFISTVPILDVGGSVQQPWFSSV